MGTYWRVVAILVVGAVAAAACGGSDVGSSPTPEIAQGAENGASNGSPGALEIDWADAERALASAQRLVERLGDADAAMDALLVAAELGYTGPQLIEGVASATLQADGTINGQAPDGARLNRINLDIRSGQAARASKIQKRPVAAAMAHKLLQQSDDKILLERLRESATDYGGFEYDRQQLVGLEGVALILLLISTGATPEQVIETLVLGVYFYETDGICYSRALPFKANEPVERPCDGSAEDIPASEATDTNPAAPDVLAEPGAGAVYQGDLSSLDFVDSRIVVSISPDGVVTGELVATELLDGYIGSVDLLCGLLEDEDDPEDCSDAVVTCRATVLWSSNLQGLVFTGDPPDSGTVAGTIALTWDTNPDGCDEPSTETNNFEIEATVAPDAAQITVPFTLDLERIEPAS